MKWTQHWAATAPSPTHPERNEDNWWVARSAQAAAVIDGMGGYRRRSASGEVGGEHAAQLAAQVLAKELDDWQNTLSLQEARPRLRQAIEAVNRAIWEELNWGGRIPAEENPEGKSVDELSVGVALTVVALCDGGSRAVAAQHGDTHGYVIKESTGLIQITEDQDLLLWERLNGTLSEEEAAAITQTIDQFDGTDLSAMLDQKVMRYFFDKNIFGALGVDGVCPETGWSVIKLLPGDRLVLLSDGAYSNMSHSELTGLLGYPDDPASVVVELAKQRSVLPRFPDPNSPSKPFNMRATQDDMTAVVVVVGEAAAEEPDAPASPTAEPDEAPAALPAVDPEAERLPGLEGDETSAPPDAQGSNAPPDDEAAPLPDAAGADAPPDDQGDEVEVPSPS